MKTSFKTILFCLCIGFWANECKAQDISLWNGEISTVNSCNYSNGEASNSSPHTGLWAFKGTINQWKSGIINLKCQNTWRIDLSNYSEVQFYLKADVAGAFIKFGFTAWPYSSNMVDITPYVQDGPINSDYKLVKIPIAVLKNQNCQLNSVEQIRFETTGTDMLVFYADDFSVVDVSPTKIDSINFLSNQVIKLNCSERYDMEDVKKLTNYTVSSADDPDFLQAQNPARVGRHFFVKEFPEFSSNPITKNEMFLVFNQKLKNGSTYKLTVDNVKDLSGNNFTQAQVFDFTFNDQQLINNSVKINQVGYFTWGPKYGYIGNYLGDAGSLNDFPNTFSILNAKTNAIVLSGIPEFKGNDLQRSGETVFECDFSSLNTPGKYYLYVPGVGRSYDFEINEHVMDSVYYTTARSLFYQRCGMDLAPPFADPRWSHPACHQNDGISHSSWLNSPLYNGEAINQYIPAKFGWHDAGDYGKYTVSACSALYYLFNIYDLFPEKFADKELNIPESGNGVPDILDEARHEIVWLMNMQAPDGGVFERITTANWPTTMPQEDLATRYISEKTTPATAQFAAIMAMGYRLFLPFWPELANTCLDQSKLALNFLLAHPDVLPVGGYYGGTVGIGGGDYSGPGSDVDERAWAAAELYKSTGESYYQELFHTYWSQNPPNWGWNHFLDHQINASITYATTTKYPTDAEKVSLIKTSLLASANTKLINRLDTSLYRSACGQDIGFGAYGQSSRYSLDLIMAYALSGDEKFKKYALLSLDIQLGNNPQNKTYITGIGSNYPLHPLHHPSLHDGVAEPVPGIPVFGPNAHLGLSNIYNIMVQDPKYLYPSGETADSPYPILRRYYDISSNPAMSEFTIIDEAITSSVFGFFKSAPLQSVDLTPVTPKQTTTLHYFSGDYSQNSVVLKWEMASEFQVASYQIERSKDGINFFQLTQLSSLGDSDSPQQYTIYDNQPLSILDYYRLKIVQSDGTITYSPIISVNIPDTKHKKFLLFPNPVVDKVNLQVPVYSNTISKWNVIITDINGRIVFQTYNDLISLTEQINQALPKIYPGVYIIEVKNQEERMLEKFIRK